MPPEGYGPLSRHDHATLLRLNLCCTAIFLLVFVFLVVSCGWQVRALAILASGSLVLLARQVEPILRRLDRGIGTHGRVDTGFRPGDR